MRVCITGGPKTGKTTLSKDFENVIHCDDFIASHGWSEASAHIATLMLEDGPWTIEGVQVPRALRKALAANPEAKPCDRLIVRSRRVGNDPILKGQDAMTKGLHTVLAEIMPALRRLGVEIEETR